MKGIQDLSHELSVVFRDLEIPPGDPFVVAREQVLSVSENSVSNNNIPVKTS